MKNIKNSKFLINTFSKELNIKFSSNNNIYENWKKIIGNEKIANNSELFDINKNTIIIKTNHTGWSQQILLRKKSIIKNINKIYKNLKIKDLSIFIENNNISNKLKPLNSNNNNFKENENKELDLKLKKILESLKSKILDNK